MSAASATQTIPRPALWCLVALAAASILAAAAGRHLSIGDLRVPESAVIESRDLLFVDRAGGGVEVRDGGSGALLDLLVAGEGGFVRGVMRGFARERMLAKVGREQPVRLLARQDGLLSLVDPTTGRAVELNAFGPTNLASFSRYLASHPAPKEGRT